MSRSEQELGDQHGRADQLATGPVQALGTWAYCAICSARILPVDLLCPACADSPRGRALLKRRARRDARTIGSRWELAMRLARHHRLEAARWLRLAREAREAR